MNDENDYIEQARVVFKTEIDELQRLSEKIDLRFARAAEAAYTFEQYLVDEVVVINAEN